jgi:hypothetical protein
MEFRIQRRVKRIYYEFIEIMDVDYASMPGQPISKADVVVSRIHGQIQHQAE